MTVPQDETEEDRPDLTFYDEARDQHMQPQIVSTWSRAVTDPPMHIRFPPVLTDEALQERVNLRRESAGPEIFRFFGPDETIARLTRRSWDLLVLMDAATKQPNEHVSEIRKLISNVQWRVVIGLPLIVFQSKGRRWANPSERAALNLCRTLGDNIVPTKRLLEWTGDHISCTKNWLKRTSVRNLLQAMDLWKRFTDGANGLSGLDKAMCTVEGRDPTVVVARGLECANHISCLLLDYARLATEQEACIDS